MKALTIHISIKRMCPMKSKTLIILDLPKMVRHTLKFLQHLLQDFYSVSNHWDIMH